MKDPVGPQKWLFQDRFCCFHSGQGVSHLFVYCRVLFRPIVVHFTGNSSSSIVAIQQYSESDSELLAFEQWWRDNKEVTMQKFGWAGVF